MTLSKTKQFIKDEVARGAAPAIATIQVLREVVETELRDLFEEALTKGDHETAQKAMAEMLEGF